MSNNTFAWGEVTNATGYFVGFSGEVVHVIGGTAVPVSAFGKIATPVDGVSVIAYGNGVNNTYGEVVSGSVLLTELANFSDADNGAVNYVQGVKNNKFREDPTYVDDTVKFAAYLDSYDNTWSVNLSAFQVELPKGLDVSKNGIVVRVNIYDHSGSVSPTHVAMLPNVDKAEWDAIEDITTLPNTEFTAKGTWMELKVSSADLTTLGYANGDTTLSFGGWVKNAIAQNGGGAGIWYQLDEISYYSEGFSLDTPTELAVSDRGLISWTEVSNADKYTVDIDGTEYETTTNRYQIEEFTSDVTVKVRAISNGEYWSASAWTEEVATNCFTLATFTDENNGAISGLEGYVWGTESYRPGYEPTYADGTVKAGIRLDRYHAAGGSTKLAAFKVTLPTGLDLSKGGIVVKVQIYDKSSVLTLDKFTLLTKDGQSAWQSGSSADFIGVAMNYQEWMEVKLSSADLQAMGYATGDTVLYFGGWVSNEEWQASANTGIWFQLDEINYYIDNTLDQLAEQIVYDDTQAMELGAYIAPTSAILTNWNGTAYNANNIYQAAGLNSFNIVVTTDSVFEDIDLALTRCGWAQIDTYLQLHNGMTADVNGWTKFQALFSGVDLTEYPYLKGFFIADEPSWTQMEVIETYYVPWFNENYAKSGLEFCVNLLGGYSTAIGALRDENGNSLGTYEGTEEDYRVCHTAYVNKWLGIFATVKSSNKSLTLDSYPLMDNQEDLLTELDGSNLPEGYERVLYDDWLRRSMNMANFARDNGHAFGAFIQAFDEGWTDSARTYRLPTKVEEIKWQAYMNIALGAKRLMYYGFDARSGGHYMTASGAQPTAIYNFVQATNAELATLDHVFMAFDTWVGAKTFIPSGATASTAIAGVADIELGALTNVSGVTTDGELVVGEMVDNHGNHGYMLVGYNDPFDGVSTEVSMTFDGADGFIVYRAGDNVRTFVKDTNGLLSLTLGAGEGVFVIPVYAK